MLEVIIPEAVTVNCARSDTTGMPHKEVQRHVKPVHVLDQKTSN